MALLPSVILDGIRALIAKMLDGIRAPSVILIVANITVAFIIGIGLSPGGINFLFKSISVSIASVWQFELSVHLV